MRRHIHILLTILALLFITTPTLLHASNGTILQQKRNANGEGYIILKVWGTHYQMGYAQGKLLAKEILFVLQEVRQKFPNYKDLKKKISTSIWKPDVLEKELDGMVAGIKAAQPKGQVDKLDLKLLNSYSDWAYACRSHSAWGSFVKAPTKTLSTRRLDYPSQFKTSHVHVLVIREPSDGSVKWVNLAWPGYVVSITSVNEYGTQVSLHDFQSQAILGKYMPRSVAARYALTLIKGLAATKHLDTVYTTLRKYAIATSGFINYFVPEGFGGVITCLKGQKCSKKRIPQATYFKGQVLLTTNEETDGKKVPVGGEFMETYYKKGGTKTLADHYGLMGHTGLHLMSVAYRKHGDMTIWFEGRLTSGVTPTIKLEFSKLYAKNPLPKEKGPGENISQEPTANEIPNESAVELSEEPESQEAQPEESTAPPSEPSTFPEESPTSQPNEWKEEWAPEALKQELAQPDATTIETSSPDEPASPESQHSSEKPNPERPSNANKETKTGPLYPEKPTVDTPPIAGAGCETNPQTQLSSWIFLFLFFSLWFLERRRESK